SGMGDPLMRRNRTAGNLGKRPSRRMLATRAAASKTGSTSRSTTTSCSASWSVSCCRYERRSLAGARRPSPGASFRAAVDACVSNTRESPPLLALRPVRDPPDDLQRSLQRRGRNRVFEREPWLERAEHLETSNRLGEHRGVAPVDRPETELAVPGDEPRRRHRVSALDVLLT